MSCHSTPGNRAVLSIARHYAEKTAGHPIPEVDAQRAFHSLSAEGRRLHFPTPDPRDVRRWFDEAAFAVMIDIPPGRSRDAALRNLELARQGYEHDPSTVPGDVFHAWRFTADLTSYTASRQEHPNPVTVAFDCDGVLYDFNGTIREWLAARGWRREDMPDPEVYWLPDAWRITEPEFFRELDMSVQAGVMFQTGAPFRDGTTMARQIGQSGHHMIVNTARALEGKEQEVERATIAWLRSHGVHPDLLHMSDPADARDKLRAHFDVLFDDHSANVEAARAAGRHAFLIRRGWNDHEPETVLFHDVPHIVENLQVPTTTP